MSLLQRISRGAALTVACALLAPSVQAGGLFSAARQAAAKRALAPPAATAAAKSAVPAAPVGKPHDVIISRSRHPQAAAHIEHAQRQGQPTVLHIDRRGAAQRRIESTGSVDPQRKPAPHYERDEYPPALVREGGHNANVRYIDRHDNRGAGGTLAAQTRRLPDGARIRILTVD
jgi:hypothetical protein